MRATSMTKSGGVGGGTSSSSSSSSTVHTILKTTTVAGMALVGSVVISTLSGRQSHSQSHSQGNKENAHLFKWNKAWTFLRETLLWDWPVWIGAAWIVARQLERRTTSSNTIESESSTSSSGGWGWQLLSDVTFTGLVMVLRPLHHHDHHYKHVMGKTNDDDNDDSSDDPNDTTTTTVTASESRDTPVVAPHADSHTTTPSAADHFFERIQANLGLTPQIHNIDLSAGLVLTTGDSPSLLVSALAQRQPPTTTPPAHQRYLEMLVHNVSHTDLVLSLKAPEDSIVHSHESEYCLCRPRFSAFEAYSRRVLEALSCHGDQLKTKLISFPRHARSEAEHRRRASWNGETGDDDDKGPLASGATLPIGFSLEGLSCGESRDEQHLLLQVSPEERNDLRLRGKDNVRLDSINQSCTLNAAFFPLLGTLLPQWQARLQEKYGSMERSSDDRSSHGGEDNLRCKKVIILVSGVGSPRNWTHSMGGNSTNACAKLIELFINTLYPEVTVVRLHSNTNIFRYDENIAFVQNELLPCVQTYRDAHATGQKYPDEVEGASLDGDTGERVDHTSFDPDWNQSMSVTLSFADGSPARNHAIQAALRSYKPTYFHCWQLKTFWHEMKIVDSDIEVHSFEEMETLPPIDLTTPLSIQKFHQQQPIALQVVEEMKAFKMEMESILQNSDNDHDLRSFWMRKTQKPVIAVLAVQMTKNGPVKLYRGTNMEVSMPTGSLCAERNVIGTALAENPSLKRHHLKIIAVLSVRANKPDISGSRSRATSTNSLISFAPSATSSRRNSIEVEENAVSAKGRPPRSSRHKNSGEWLLQDIAPAEPPNNVQDAHSAIVGDAAVPFETDKAHVTLTNTPARRISLYQHNPNTSNNAKDHHHGNISNRKSVVVLQSPEDLNPLRPCGACNEWLKKISQSSPYFQILTFTDTDCSGVYCSPVAE